MTTTTNIPTLAEWAGGMPALERLTDVFYAKVIADPLLGPVFSRMDPAHARHVAAFIAEVFGGGKPYSEELGSHASMIRRHANLHLTEEMRRRWIDLIVDAADEVGLPVDPEFRAAFVGYLEWGTRLAVINSQPGAEQPQDGMPMPTWGWGPPGGPWQG
jgi:hemoglobin